MLDFDIGEYVPLGNMKRLAPRHHGPLATGAAVIMLVFGAIFGRIGLFCTNSAMRWTDAATVRTWVHAVEHFRGMTPGTRLPKARWERSLLRFGSSILLGIGATLIVMWLLLLLGGALAWLAYHGFGLVLLFGAVLIGTIIGTQLARLGRFGGNQERLN